MTKPMTVAEFDRFAWIAPSSDDARRIREAIRQREELVQWEAKWRALSKAQDEVIGTLAAKCEELLLACKLAREARTAEGGES